MPGEAAVCRADEVVVIDLIASPKEFFDPAPEVKILSRTPVLFVPGLLSTEIKRGNELLWIEPSRIAFPFDSDDFLAFSRDDDFTINCWLKTLAAMLRQV